MTSRDGRRRDEPDALAAIVRILGGAQASVQLPNGTVCRVEDGVAEQDDAAVVSVSGPATIVAASDYVRGPKFRLAQLGLLDEYDLGWYLAAANLSDIAAMGAAPIGLLSVVRYPPGMTDAAFEALLRGIADCCRSCGTASIGGDTGTAERLVLSASALGAAAPERVLRRTGARPGDALMVTGPTGTAGAALRYFTRLADGPDRPRLDEAVESELLASWKRPLARVAEGAALAASGAVTACIDTSDGLRGALEGLAAGSGVGFEVNEALLPVVPAVAEVAEWAGAEVLDVVLGDSVDFQLAFTTGRPDDVRAEFARFGLPAPVLVGVAIGPTAGLVLAGGGRFRPLPGNPWRHRA